MNLPLISVVIATWNRKDDLKEVLEKYLNNSYKNIEIIVVDNNSTDGTKNMVVSDFKDVKLISLSENTGVKAYNIGIKEAKGDIIYLSDNDAYLEEDGFFKIVNKFQKGSKNLAVVSCEIVYIPQNIIYEWYSRPIDRNNLNPNGYEAHLFIGAGAAIKREVFKKVGYYDESFFLFFNENELSTRIIGAGYDIKYFPDIKVYHKTSSKRYPNRTRYLTVRNMIWYYWKYFPIHIAFGRTIIRLPFECIISLYHRIRIFEIFKTIYDTFNGLPNIIKNREPIPKKYVKKALRYENVFQDIFHWIQETQKRRKQLKNNS
jgi:GT2 family glycosyltransferase